MRTFKIIKSKEKEITFKLVDQYNECQIKLNSNYSLWNNMPYFHYDIYNGVLNKFIHQTRFKDFNDLIKYIDKFVGPNNLKDFKDNAQAAIVALKV